MKISNHLKIFVLVIMILLILVLLCLLYAFKIEPYRLIVEEISIGDTDATSNLSIVQFSDTHIKEDFNADNLSVIVDEINSLSADLVIFTGDLYDNYSVYKDDENIISQLSRINANIGKIAIWGNRDYGGGAVRQYENIITDSGFTLLSNQSILLTTKDDNNIVITAIDDSLMGNPKMPNTYFDEADYRIFLSHEPDVIENYPIADYDLILCGHTHGGQVNIPFLPFVNEYALNETALSSKYNSGLTKLDTENEPHLYIDTGIGTTRISARFMVIPKVTKFTISLRE